MTQFDTDDEEIEDEGTGLVADLRKQLRDAKREAKALSEQVGQNQGAARRIAFLDAGIPDTPQTKFFREHYDGDLDPETIKSMATEHGFLTDVDRSAEIGDIASQSEAAAGAQGPNVMGGQEEYEAELDKAVKAAPRGGESAAIAEVVARYSRQV
jgi:hypothetical protein